MAIFAAARTTTTGGAATLVTAGPVFIIGAARSGTTALAESVAASFGLALVRDKESHFLAAQGMPERHGGPRGTGFDRRRDKTIGEFQARLSRHNTGSFLDASTSSLYYASAAAGALNQYFPNARLIAVLRNPVDVAESAHRYMTARGLERLSLAEALREERRRIADDWPHIWHYTRTGHYADQVDALGVWRERTLFLLYETDLRSNTLIDRIADHIGYAPLRRHPPVQRNEARAFTSPVLGRSAEWIRSTRLVSSTPQWVRRQGRQWADKLRAPVAQPSNPVLRETLRAEFEPELDRLAELTGLNVRRWFGE
ncbi:sulfotransferase [Mycolicibacterium elephantis]